MRRHFRLLPLTISFAVLLLLIKVVHGFYLGQDIMSSLFVAPVVAQEAEGQPAAEEGGAGDAEGGEEAKDGEEKSEDDDIFGGFLEIKEKKLTAEDLIGNQLGGTRPNDRRFSPLELKILQQLAERRKDLDVREEQLVLKENLLTQTEKRVDEKFSEMKELKAQLSNIIERYREVEETKIKSLVKIYESMKPNDAARIFNQMEMPILITVIDRMSERKAAPILAGMDPKKAKELTVELAEKRRVEDEKARMARIKAQEALEAQQ